MICMENVLRLIYNKTVKNEVLNLKDIEQILELLIVNKDLNKYILNIDVQPIRSNNLASYSSYTKNITIYAEMIKKMIEDIEMNILNANEFEVMLYKNLSILQILLHETEHANQQKIADNDNNLEAFIIRLSYLVDNAYEDEIYEYCPEEKLAEVKSFEEIIDLMKYLEKESIRLPEIFDIERLNRLLRGYHYIDSHLNIPLETYFTMAKRQDLFCYVDLSLNLSSTNFNASLTKYKLQERLRYGFPISELEYGTSMRKLVLSLNRNFKNKTNVRLK